MPFPRVQLRSIAVLGMGKSWASSVVSPYAEGGQDGAASSLLGHDGGSSRGSFLLSLDPLCTSV